VGKDKLIGGGNSTRPSERPGNTGWQPKRPVGPCQALKPLVRLNTCKYKDMSTNYSPVVIGDIGGWHIAFSGVFTYPPTHTSFF
jgi:hypothetical protein